MQSYRTMADVLEDYTLQSRSLGTAKALLEAFPEHRQELRALFQVIDRMRRALMPVRPALAFRKELQQALIEAAEHRNLPKIIIRSPFRRQRILLGAAIGSAVSVTIGIVAAVLIHKSGQRSHGVPSA